ncbi:MAG: hypothetical protein KTV68_05230 [Acidimicrobiia bacterium]|nr:hypothetical protein [Acidimicrobiia bacterium]MCY4433938.1 hypothetical protein [bacterium]
MGFRMSSRLAVVMCWVAGLSALVAAIGALLPWATVEGPFSDFFVEESDTPETTVLVCAGIGALSAAGFAQWRKRRIGTLGLLAGLVITLVGAVNLANGGVDAQDFMDTSPEAGLYMVVIAGALLVISTGFLTFMRQSSELVAESDECLVGGEGEDDEGD